MCESNVRFAQFVANLGRIYFSRFIDSLLESCVNLVFRFAWFGYFALRSV